MNEKNKIIEEFITEMLKATVDDYIEIKYVLLSGNADNPAVMKFLKTAFDLVESHRPLLIEVSENNA